ncbi:hypothetical protein H7U19_15405 [Hyunsoonleella sp. SJ7]|uniref:Uncharacterized protein n=1 Tax=Hyunsoonleella aquatilis TaxID=2762758 RepID=A0A923HC23_9FLAO|nr:DUF6090 family protein [Hyunsoonleella aquatilis]MBC3759799.1 hypothetical protein [Hyunsoonleella aquatilis]
MIKFFRKIRQKLLSENKFSKYLLYAIGEIVLVVIGILIALQINNLNEERKLLNKRDSLISSLIEDFEFNTTEIKTILLLSEKQLNTMDNYFNLISQTNQTVSVDSLRTLARSFFTYETFIPNMTAYNEAESSGNLSLLNYKLLLQEFTKLQQEIESLQLYNKAGIYTFHDGSSWEFRKTVEPGTIYNSIYSGSTAKDIPYSDYQRIMQSPLAKNALQNQNMMIGNCYHILKRMLNHSENILEILNKMKSPKKV